MKTVFVIMNEDNLYYIGTNYADEDIKDENFGPLQSAYIFDFESEALKYMEKMLNQEYYLNFLRIEKIYIRSGNN